MESVHYANKFSRAKSARGFSLVEMTISVAITMLLMSAVFPFIIQAQKRLQGTQVEAESNQGARGAMELMTQEIGQAGYNPNFSPNRTCAVPVTPNADPQCVTINDISSIGTGDWLSVDTGVNNEFVQVTGTTATGACASAKQIQAVFIMNHTSPTTTFPFRVASYKLPYPTGILTGAGTSNDHVLEFFGDINGDGVISYVVYSLQPTTTPSTTIQIKGQNYTLYNLMRSITPVQFASGAHNIAASPIARNVIYQDISTANPLGATGKPLFAFPSTILVGIVPNQTTVVGTLVVTLCVAVNPQSIETNKIEWRIMSTQIRPLNLSAAVQVNQAGGYKFLPKQPVGLPML
jgi:type II secretory pathway pseudopilin PulG